MARVTAVTAVTSLITMRTVIRCSFIARVLRMSLTLLADLVTMSSPVEITVSLSHRSTGRRGTRRTQVWCPQDEKLAHLIQRTRTVRSVGHYRVRPGLRHAAPQLPQPPKLIAARISCHHQGGRTGRPICRRPAPTSQLGLHGQPLHRGSGEGDQKHRGAPRDDPAQGAAQVHRSAPSRQA